MRTTLNLDKSLIDQAARMTGITEKTALIRMGLERLIAEESALRLSKLAGTEPSLQKVNRRRSP
ncbi:MAG: type II toxin-antitoxin system VapB family antitoxin [Verrucomicrobia bacterium]|nr:type II toxin-antitoxin system VapB family antitoxin [Verrucomicrobiota bacterium]MCH8527904.1 type II toxin-antitoxin system VapB family antitoxin [Kiritimatiellia bacterium]